MTSSDFPLAQTVILSPSGETWNVNIRPWRTADTNVFSVYLCQIPVNEHFTEASSASSTPPTDNTQLEAPSETFFKATEGMKMKLIAGKADQHMGKVRRTIYGC